MDHIMHIQLQLLSFITLQHIMLTSLMYTAQYYMGPSAQLGRTRAKVRTMLSNLAKIFYRIKYTIFIQPYHCAPLKSCTFGSTVTMQVHVHTVVLLICFLYNITTIFSL